MGTFQPMHTHKHSANQKTKMKTTEGVINIPQPAEGPETEMIAILTKDRGSGGEEYHKLPPQDDPILRQWLLTKGIDITNFDSIASNITEEDIRVREMSESDLIQWKKNIYDRLAAKRRRKDNKKWIMQATERDKQLEPDLRQIKSYLVNTDSIMANNHVDIDQMYKAWSIATGKRDRQRTFRNELHGYIGCGYFTPLDSKYKKFRVEDKLMSL